MLIALGLAFLLPPKVLPPLTPVALVLLAGFLLYLRGRLARGAAEDASHRAVDHAEIHRHAGQRIIGIDQSFQYKSQISSGRV